MLSADISVEAEEWRDLAPDIEAHCLKTLVDAGAALGLENTTLAVLLDDDAVLQDLNNRFRGKDKPTNVLSFPAPPTPTIFGWNMAGRYESKGSYQTNFSFQSSGKTRFKTN